MIYSLVSRGQSTVLSSYTASSGNFPAIALDVLSKTDLQRMFGQFSTANYNFYTFIKENFVFLVMVQSDYETRIAANFLKKVQDAFFSRYEKAKRTSAVAHSLKDFDKVLEERMREYGDKTKVDKLVNIKQQLSELEEQALRNMNKVIDRGEKIQILVKKTQVLADQSYDMRATAKKVKDKMWWKNKKVLIAIVLVVLVIIAVVIIIVVAK